MLRLLAFLRPYRKQVALAVLLGCATIASNVGLLAVATYLIAAAALKPLLITLAAPMYLVRILGVTRAFFRYGERLVSHRATLTLLAELRTWFYRQLEPLAPARLLEYRSGDLLARTLKDIEELENIYLRVFSPLLVALIMSCLAVGVLAVFSPLLAITAAAFLALAGVGVPMLVLRLGRGPGARQVAVRAELNVQLIDGIQGMPDLLACGQAADQQQRVVALDRESGHLQRRVAWIAGLQSTLADLSMNLAVWVALVLAIPLVTQRTIGGLYLAFVALVVLGSFEAVQPLGQSFQRLGRTTAAAKRLFELVEVAPQVSDPTEPRPLPIFPDLEFNRVSFAYDPASGPVLEEISFRLHPGAWIAVVGPSGAGKSTLANLALRFWDPTGGVISLGGHALRDYALDDLRGAIGIVGQDTYIFTDTLRNNLLMARPAASDAELAAALARAQLAELVARLPRGLDTWIGEQGMQLSGGERQRLAIARTVLKDAPILILDEATANLDPLTEAALLDALYDAMREHTVLAISHRLVGLERMDEILVLDHGRIVERGTHGALLAMHGLYEQLFEAQNQLVASV